MKITTLIPLLSVFSAAAVVADSSTGQCGTNGGGLSCLSLGTVNSCCSPAGWCGDSTAHCGSGCQAGYGDCTPEPTPAPIGPRPKLGSVPYGTDIYRCTRPGTVALTFDDGPYIYTNELLDLLWAKNVKATFFLTGANLAKGNIDSTPQWRDIITRMYRDGHQIASHTWEHPDLSLATESTRRYQMTRLEQALLSIIGRYPTYMRPPFISCNAACRATMNTMGYHVIIWDLDTDDYNNLSPTLIQNSKNIVANAYAGGTEGGRNWMSIAHDIHLQSVRNLTAYQIDLGKSRGFTHTTLGDCLSDPKENWYRTTM